MATSRNFNPFLADVADSGHCDASSFMVFSSLNNGSLDDDPQIQLLRTRLMGGWKWAEDLSLVEGQALVYKLVGPQGRMICVGFEQFGPIAKVHQFSPNLHGRFYAIIRRHPGGLDELVVGVENGGLTLMKSSVFDTAARLKRFVKTVEQEGHWQSVLRRLAHTKATPAPDAISVG